MTEDTNANRVLWLIERNPYTESTEADSIAATHAQSGEMFIVRGDDVLTMAAELAGLIGIELMDG